MAERAVEKVSPISGEMKRQIDAPDALDAPLVKGAEKAEEKAEELANPILERTFEIMGFVRGRR